MLNLISLKRTQLIEKLPQIIKLYEQSIEIDSLWYYVGLMSYLNIW